MGLWAVIRNEHLRFAGLEEAVNKVEFNDSANINNSIAIVYNENVYNYGKKFLG